MKYVNARIPMSLPCMHCGQESTIIPMMVEDEESRVIPSICFHCGFFAVCEHVSESVVMQREPTSGETLNTLQAMAMWILEDKKAELHNMTKKQRNNLN